MSSFHSVAQSQSLTVTMLSLCALSQDGRDCDFDVQPVSFFPCLNLAPELSSDDSRARLAHDRGDFVEIIEMLDKRLNDKGKNWRHVFKSLTVLDYILHAGSENVVHYFRENLYIVKTLKEFQYIDEDGKDQGANGTSRFCASASLGARTELNSISTRLQFDKKRRTSLRYSLTRNE